VRLACWSEALVFGAGAERWVLSASCVASFFLLMPALRIMRARAAWHKLLEPNSPDKHRNISHNSQRLLWNQREVRGMHLGLSPLPGDRCYRAVRKSASDNRPQ
jgi:hypothetical protein